MKIVLDTNTLVSAIGWHGPPRLVLLTIRAGNHRLITSTELLDELILVLNYPKLAPVRESPLLPFLLEWLFRPEHLVVTKEKINVIQNDPSDNRVIEAAIAGKADVIISGDQHLLGLGSYRAIEIISASQFCKLHIDS